MIKYLLRITILSLIMLFSSSCTSAVNKNTIQNMQLSDEQRKVIDLATTDTNEIYLFSYNVDDTFKDSSIWLEVYEYGNLVEKRGGGGMSSNFPDKNTKDYNIALIINKDKDFVWTFVQNINATKASYKDSPIPYYKDASIYSTLDRSIHIEPGKEIVLYSIHFSDTSKLRSIGDIQEFATNTKPLEDYTHSYIIKCKFTK